MSDGLRLLSVPSNITTFGGVVDLLGVIPNSRAFNLPSSLWSKLKPFHPA